MIDHSPFFQMNTSANNLCHSTLVDPVDTLFHLDLESFIEDIAIVAFDGYMRYIFIMGLETNRFSHSLLEICMLSKTRTCSSSTTYDLFQPPAEFVFEYCANFYDTVSKHY